MSAPLRSNRGFRCKQFFVAHQHCPMKVTTDSLLLGSFADASSAKRCLDIGTGCGILALMLAQKSPPTTHIEAIDIHRDAVLQAAENALACPWPSKIAVRAGDIREFSDPVGFDVIIANPPYFSEVDQSASAYSQMSAARGAARLESGLTVADLFFHSRRLAGVGAHLYCIYPYARVPEVLVQAKSQQWHLNHRVDVKHSATETAYVSLLAFSLAPAPLDFDELVLRTEDNSYTEAFRCYCQAFYVNF